MTRDNSQSGFTLIELMIAMVISGVLLTGMVMAFTAQSRSYNTQERITALQEDIRASLSLMSSEIRMAGYNPTGDADPAITTATATQFRFTQDITDDAGTGASDGDTEDANEDISYTLTAGGVLQRQTIKPAAPNDILTIAENIEQLGFEYLIDVDADTWTQAPPDLKKIRAVKISILGRTPQKTSSATGARSFNPPFSSASPDWTTPATPGNYQRRMMSVTVQCRNLQE